MAFEEVKARLVADPVLACPDFSRTFILQTDASDYGTGGRKSNLLFEPNTERREEELFNNGEGVLGDCLGDPEAQAISGRLPL